MKLPFLGKEPVPTLFPTNAETACVADDYHRYRKDGVKQTTTRGILHNFVEFLQGKYYPIQVYDACLIPMEKDVQSTLPLRWRNFLDTPVTEEELKAAVSKGACNKAPRIDSICLDFFKVDWDNIKDGIQAIFNRMYLDGRIMEQQTHGIVVRITRPNLSITPADYEPIYLAEHRL